MGIRHYKPTTPGRRGASVSDFADITEMKSSQSRMERMAFYDTLTNLANRRLFYDRLGQAVDHAQRSRARQREDPIALRGKGPVGVPGRARGPALLAAREYGRSFAPMECI